MAELLEAPANKSVLSNRHHHPSQHHLLDLDQNDAKFRTLIEQLPAVVYINPASDPTHTLYVSPQVQEMLGYTPEEWVANPNLWSHALHPEDRDSVLKEIERCRESGAPLSLQYRLVAKDGHVIWVHDHTALVYGADGEPQFWQGVMIDITDRKEAERLRHEGEDRLRVLIEHGGDSISLIGADGHLLWESPAVVRNLGYEHGAFIGQNIFQLVHPDDQSEMHTRFANLIKTPGGNERAELRLRHRDGSWRWVDLVASNLLDHPTIHGVVLNYRDITDRKRAEGRIQRQLRYLHALHEVDEAIASTVGLSTTLDILLQQVTGHLDVDAADVLLFRPVSQMLEQTAGRGFRFHRLAKESVRLGQGYAGRAALERETVHIPDLRSANDNPRLASLLAGEDFVSYYAVPLIAKGKVVGVLEVFHRSMLAPERDWLELLNTLAGQAAIAVDNGTIYEKLERSNMELQMAYDATIKGWSHAMDLRDKETEGHTERVTEMTIKLARLSGFSDEELIHIRRGALLHDVGKMGVPDHILLKPGKLTDEEWGIMRQHPQFAYDMISPIRYLQRSLSIPYCHHEKWDGTGYPRGLKGEAIPLEARLFAVVDVWDALTSDRPYRPAWSREKALEYIQSGAGTHFDPEVVKTCLKSGIF